MTWLAFGLGALIGAGSVLAALLGGVWLLVRAAERGEEDRP